jgi:hypothetical protein
MSSNQDIDQPFDDDMMLQLALQMSMQQDPAAATSLVVSSAAAPGENTTMAVDSPAHSPAHAAGVATAAVAATDMAASTPTTPVPAALLAIAADAASVSPVKKKKKKKKNSYKDMMAGVMAPTRTEEEANRAQEEKMKRTLGGGQFSKLDKI